jgi:hypothetical protein
MLHFDWNVVNEADQKMSIFVFFESTDASTGRDEHGGDYSDQHSDDDPIASHSSLLMNRLGFKAPVA